MEAVAFIVLTILIVLLVALTGREAYKFRHHLPFYAKVRKLFKKRKPEPTPPPDTRMFVAIRRQPAGRAAMAAATIDEYEEKKREIKEQFKLLLSGWESLVGFKFGFHGSEYGLPSNNDENWMLFASFEVPGHDVFKECLAYLGQETFFALRNQLDIRLLFGEKIDFLEHHLDELFS